MKKKILATLLAGVMVLSLAACGSNESKKDGSDTAKSDEGATHIYVLTADRRSRMDRFCCNICKRESRRSEQRWKIFRRSNYFF